MSGGDGERPGRRSRARSGDDGVPYLRVGQWISLVSWTRDDDRWQYRTVSGELLGRDGTTWRLRVDGKDRVMSAQDWAFFT
jgi:hypothetical protein